MIVRELITKLGFQVNGAALAQANQGMVNLQNGAERAADSVSKIGNRLAVMATAYLSFQQLKGIMDVTMEVEDLTTSFKVMLGSATEANKMVTDLRTMGASTPFEFSDLAGATKTLLQMQISSKEVLPTLNMLGDVAMGNREKMQSLALVFGQVSMTGKLQGGDLMQLINAGFNPLNYVVKKTGESMAQVKDRMSRGGVSAKEVTEAFKMATSAGGQFYKGMEEGSKTLSGLKSTLDDAVKSVKLAIGQKLLESSKDIVKGLTHFVEGLIPVITKWADYYIPLLLGSMQDLWAGVKKAFVDSGVLTQVTLLFYQLTEGSDEGASGLDRFISTVVELVAWLSGIATTVLAVVNALVWLNDATGNSLVFVGKLVLQFGLLYKVATLMVGLFPIVGAEAIAAGAAATTASKGFLTMQASMGLIGIAIMAAVAAYQLFDYWATKVDEDREARERNLEVHAGGKLTQATVDEEAGYAKELRAIKQRSVKGMDYDDALRDLERVREIEKAMGKQEGALAGSVGYVKGTSKSAVQFTDQLGGTLHMMDTAGKVKALMDKEAAKKAEPKQVNQTNKIDQTFNLPATTDSKQAKQLGKHAQLAMESAFSMQLERVLYSSI